MDTCTAQEQNASSNVLTVA